MYLKMLPPACMENPILHTGSEAAELNVSPGHPLYITPAPSLGLPPDPHTAEHRTLRAHHYSGVQKLYCNKNTAEMQAVVRFDHLTARLVGSTDDPVRVTAPLHAPVPVPSQRTTKHPGVTPRRHRRPAGLPFGTISASTAAFRSLWAKANPCIPPPRSPPPCAPSATASASGPITGPSRLKACAASRAFRGAPYPGDLP